MLQNLSSGFEHKQSNSMGSGSAVESQRNAGREMDAREQMIAARREMQRLYILRNLCGRH